MAVFFRVSFGDCLCFMTVAETNDEKGKGAPLKKQGRTDQKIHNSRQLIRIQIFCFHSCSFDRGCLLSLESFIKEAMILKRAVVRRQDCLFSVFRRQHLSHLREKRERSKQCSLLTDAYNQPVSLNRWETALTGI